VLRRDREGKAGSTAFVSVRTDFFFILQGVGGNSRGRKTGGGSGGVQRGEREQSTIHLGGKTKKGFHWISLREEKETGQDLIDSGCGCGGKGSLKAFDVAAENTMGVGRRGKLYLHGKGGGGSPFDESKKKRMGA